MTDTAAATLAMQPIDRAARDGRIYIVADKARTIHASAYYFDGKWWLRMTMALGTAPVAQPLGFTPHSYHPRHD